MNEFPYEKQVHLPITFDAPKFISSGVNPMPGSYLIESGPDKAVFVKPLITAESYLE